MRHIGQSLTITMKAASCTDPSVRWSGDSRWGGVHHRVGLPLTDEPRWPADFRGPAQPPSWISRTSVSIPVFAHFSPRQCGDVRGGSASWVPDVAVGDADKLHLVSQFTHRVAVPPASSSQSSGWPENDDPQSLTCRVLRTGPGRIALIAAKNKAGQCPLPDSPVGSKSF